MATAGIPRKSLKRRASEKGGTSSLGGSRPPPPEEPSSLSKSRQRTRAADLTVWALQEVRISTVLTPWWYLLSTGESSRNSDLMVLFDGEKQTILTAWRLSYGKNGGRYHHL
jgi:hypothetical protein